jgi:hypothetical protein
VALELLALHDEGEWITAECAVNNTLAVPFSFHKTARQEFRNDAEFFDWLERKAQALIDQYGDARMWPDRGWKEVEGAEA